MTGLRLSSMRDVVLDPQISRLVLRRWLVNRNRRRLGCHLLVGVLPKKAFSCAKRWGPFPNSFRPSSRKLVENQKSTGVLNRISIHNRNCRASWGVWARSWFLLLQDLLPTSTVFSSLPSRCLRLESQRKQVKSEKWDGSFFSHSVSPLRLVASAGCQAQWE